MAIDYAQLKTEIETDPLAIGYSGKTDPEIADLLNTVPAPAGPSTLDPEFVDAVELQKSVVSADWPSAANDQSKRDLWRAILAVAGGETRGVPIKNQNLRDQVRDVFGAGSQTRTNLAALQTRDASRAEILFGEGTKVSDKDVAEALRG